MRQKTYHLKKQIDEITALKLFSFLKEKIEWEESVRSRRGFTRYGKSLNWLEFENLIWTDYPEVLVSIKENTEKYCYRQQCIGVYLNFYKNSEFWCPNHTHQGTTQMIISLGQTRTLNIGTKSFSSENGDIIIFGSSAHGLPKENVPDARISIALFYI